MIAGDVPLPGLQVGSSPRMFSWTEKSLLVQVGKVRIILPSVGKVFLGVKDTVRVAV